MVHAQEARLDRTTPQWEMRRLLRVCRAYRVVSVGCNSMKLVAAVNRGTCRRFRLGAAGRMQQARIMSPLLS